MTRRRPTPTETRAAITADLWAEWLPPEPTPAPPPGPYADCPTPDALTAAVGRDADPLREAYLKARRERERGMLGDLEER